MGSGPSRPFLSRPDANTNIDQQDTHYTSTNAPESPDILESNTNDKEKDLKPAWLYMGLSTIGNATPRRGEAEVALREERKRYEELESRLNTGMSRMKMLEDNLVQAHSQVQDLRERHQHSDEALDALVRNFPLGLNFKEEETETMIHPREQTAATMIWYSRVSEVLAKSQGAEAELLHTREKLSKHLRIDNTDEVETDELIDRVINSSVANMNLSDVQVRLAQASHGARIVLQQLTAVTGILSTDQANTGNNLRVPQNVQVDPNKNTIGMSDTSLSTLIRTAPPQTPVTPNPSFSTGPRQLPQGNKPQPLQATTAQGQHQGQPLRNAQPSSSIV
ncbi:hypothetical protein ACET3X_000322 [Alternaria dauci]|uniref:Uncharacterized protein n=1 Tax=Alternaria dauci TaxID=48095 RepID=A0ABR3UU28_9PLEO